MKQSTAKITLTEHNNSICFRLELNNKTIWNDKSFMGIPVPMQNEFVSQWLLLCSRPIFLAMPVKDFEIICSTPLQEKLKTPLMQLTGILHYTNEAIKEYSDNKGIGRTHHKYLFLNASGDMRYKSFHDYLCRHSSDMLYLNQPTGFNRKTRKWEPWEAILSVPELVEFIKKEKIKKIITVNHYFGDKLLEQSGVNIFPLLRYLGVELITVHHDPYDLATVGFLVKANATNWGFDYFNGMHCLNYYWDKQFQLRDTHCSCIPQDFEQNPKLKLDEDYDIIVLSNSRYGNVQNMQDRIIPLVESMPAETLFTDIQLWYMALNYMILHVFDIHEYSRMMLNGYLHSFQFSVLQYMKYKILDMIDTDREIKVYGDEGWKEVCPQHYGGSLMNDKIEELYSESNHLYLLLNFSFSYLDASGPVYEVARRNVPWINVPPLARIPAYDSMKQIEYDSKTRLNELVNNPFDAFENRQFQDSYWLYRHTLLSNAQEIRARLFNDSLKGKEVDNFFNRQLKEHQKILDGMIREYIGKNEGFLRQTFNNLFVGKS